MLLAAAAGLALTAFVALGLWAQLRPDDGFHLPDPQMVVLGEHHLAYYRAGQGPTIVLIHGLGASSFCWRYLLPLLSRQYDVVCFDLMGFGQSSRPTGAKYTLDEQGGWLAAGISRLDLKPAVIVGSSLGGLITLWLAKFRPDLCPKAICLAPATLGARAKGWVPDWPGFDGLRPILVNRWTMPWIVGLVTGSLRILNRNSIHEYLAPSRQSHSTLAFLRAAHAIRDPRLPSLFAGLTVPVLVVRGRFDFLVRESVMNDLLALLPKAKYLRPSTAHHPQEHIPDWIADEVSAWLKS